MKLRVISGFLHIIQKQYKHLWFSQAPYYQKDPVLKAEFPDHTHTKQFSKHYSD